MALWLDPTTNELWLTSGRRPTRDAYIVTDRLERDGEIVDDDDDLDRHPGSSMVVFDFPNTRRSLRHDGPILYAVELTSPTSGISVRANMLVDTGANCSFISERIEQRLRPEYLAEASVVGPVHAPHRVPSYRLDVTVAGQDKVARVPGLQFATTPRDDQFTDGLLGRNFLAHCRLTYNGRKGSWRLAVAQRPVKG